MNPSFTVPAEYFYALAANLPPHVTARERYEQAIAQDERQNLVALNKAMASGVFTAPPPPSPYTGPAISTEQAARRLRALGRVSSSAPVCPANSTAALFTLIERYLDYNNAAVDNDPPADIQPFWDGVLDDPTLAQGHLDLVLCAITGDHINLINAIKTYDINPGPGVTLIRDVDDLAALTRQDWLAIVGGADNIDPNLLPDFTAPGTPEERFAALIRYVSRYFAVGLSDSYVDPVTIDGPAVFGTPASDPLKQFVDRYAAHAGTGFVFGQDWDPSAWVAFENAVKDVFPNDADARAWLGETVQRIDELYLMTNVGNDELRFSIMEALYARGFTGMALVQRLSPADFAEALTGTVAYAHAATIYDNAGGTGGTAAPDAGSFVPVNPDGTLVDCLAPAHLAPFGATSYLHELLRVSDGSTCKNPLAAGQTLGAMLDGRRGPLGTLQVTGANLSTRIPVVDMVNESLELVAAGATAHGAVYNTATSTLAGHALGADGHDPETLLAALPEHSSPATPVKAPAAYDALAVDFSAPGLPYSQPLDIARTYLAELGTSRYEVMRRFRKNITELVLDATQEPADFERHQWRYPVRIDIAREYLGITPEEHAQLFSTNPPASEPDATREMYGFTKAEDGIWTITVASVAEFTARTGLDYCEFVELWRAGFVQFARAGANDQFDDCEPCHGQNETIVFQNPSDPADALRRLAVFIRLWRKLKDVAGYSFAELADICKVLGLFDAGGVVNDDFVRQLAAFQMLRDELGLPLLDADDDTPGTGADRTHLLALWAGTGSRKWSWALDQLLDGIQGFAAARYGCDARPPELIRVLARHLDPLSQLAGFSPLDARDTWYARPAHTLRFAEVLAKIYASDFDVGEILFVFRDDEGVRDDDPLHWQTQREALDAPLGLPDDHDRYTLMALRRALRAVTVTDEEAAGWTWARMDAALRDELGYVDLDGNDDPLLRVGEHFFPKTLAAEGWTVAPGAEQYRTALGSTSSAMWNTPANGPFRYDPAAGELWTALPMSDEAVLGKLARLRPLSVEEQQAVRDLVYAPRADLAHVAFLFENFGAAEQALIEEADEEARWRFFQKRFALFHARCRVIAEHLAGHVAEASGRVGRSDAHGAEADADRERLVGLAWRLLRHLHGDENRGVTAWESDGGIPPATLWGAGPRTGAFAALLGLLGTGLVGEYWLDGEASVAWRELRGPMDAFGPSHNAVNAPVTGIVPAMDLVLSGDRARFVAARNGFALANRDGTPLGGAQGFSARWRGVLLVEQAGVHEFFAGAPTPDGEAPDVAAASDRRWRVTLTRGNRSWLVSSRDWPTEQGVSRPGARLALEQGAYELVVELVQPAPEEDGDEDVCPRTTGFQLKYQGPDTEGALVAVPFNRLFVDKKDGKLDEQVSADVTGVARTYLQTLYPSTLRDIRRTYIRAFKSLLFAHRFDLSAEGIADSGQSEIGYMLEHGKEFAGARTYRRTVGFRVHRAYFDPNLLPLHDNYMEPEQSLDIRARSTVQREGALFDWWERVFDYTVLRREARAVREAPVWLLFHEADENHPDDPAHLVRHLGVDLRHAGPVLSYYEGQSLALYQVPSAALEDERWAVRVWHAERWVRELDRRFLWREVVDARPAYWASDAPQLPVNGQTPGNESLTRFVRDGLLENGEPRRYQGLMRLNNGLRERARQALLAHLCGMDRVQVSVDEFARTPRDLSELLLIDVEAGMSQRASRIEEGISAVQAFVQRHELGLETGFVAQPDFATMWERRFASFRVWEACKRREVYRENWIEWDELEKARRSEGFVRLESELRRMALGSPAPGGQVYWDGPRPEPRPGVALLQEREASSMALLPAGREGFDLVMTPDRHGRGSLLAALPGVSATQTLPAWVEAAVRMGAKFVRVAAAGLPSAGAAQVPDSDAVGAGFCASCGQVHDPVADEYYFWLIDSRYYDAVDPPQDADVLVSGSDGRPAWHVAETLPTLLHWESRPMVHLMWCRVHNGEFQQPSRSAEGVRLGGSDPELVFAGRTADSLRFEVTGGVAPDGYPASPLPGFRYDLATDAAAVLPLVVNPPAPAVYPGGLAAYPYFAYFAPGAELTAALYGPVLSVASALRSHGRYRAALEWYEKVWNPLQNDGRWCVEDDLDRPCDGVVSDEVARRRAIGLHYLETLLEWGDALMRRGSPEALQKARQVVATAERILGRRPGSTQEVDGGAVQTVASFVPRPARLNPRLVAIYDRVGDRLGVIRASLDAQRHGRGLVFGGAEYVDETGLRDGWQDVADVCLDAGDRGLLASPYRFQFCLQKAQELAGDVRGLGGALLSAFEKGDGEYLASLRASHERQILELTLAIRKDQWRESDWQVQALGKTKEIAQTRRRYYQWLLDTDPISEESQYVAYTLAALGLRNASQIPEFVARVTALIPDLYVGMATTERIPVGTKLAETFSTFSRILNIMADVSSTLAGLRLTEAGWVRRRDEWHHQVEVLTIEIEQIERQILAAERRRDIALRELNNHQRQMENAAEVQAFLRDKFTNHQLYLWLQRETSALYYQMYELALYAARQAERAFNYERGHTARRFVAGDGWDDLHEGLMAGERLQLALRQMEKAYLDQNVREYELTKHISVRTHFPAAFLQLRETGVCEIEIPEWKFDLDYPGHYMRRIKNVTMTIPAVVGPYTGVHCRLTLLSSVTRVDPRLSDDADGCCDGAVRNGYGASAEDARLVKQYAATEAVATSSGQNDSGMFELNFRDERYLPFEYAGAVSRWRIELPPENNYFDPDTLSDVVLHLNYMAREGGEVLRRAAHEVAQAHVPDDGWRLFEVRHEFPTAWQRFVAGSMDGSGARSLQLRLGRNLFGFLPGNRQISITGLHVLFEAPGAAPSGHCTVELEPGSDLLAAAGEPGRCEVQAIRCVAGDEWPGLYHGVIELPGLLLPGSGELNIGTLRFSSDTGEVPRAFLLCGYTVE